MAAVVSAFISFEVSGVYQPQINEITGYLNDRGWMLPALSPLRWLWAYLLTAESTFLTDATKLIMKGQLKFKGYDLDYIQCQEERSIFTLKQAWDSNHGWVCSVAPLLILGVLFRFLAGLCLIIYVNAQTTGWAKFLAQSEAGVWKLIGNLFHMLVGTFLVLLLFSEVWVFGVLKFGEGIHVGIASPFGDASLQQGLTHIFNTTALDYEMLTV